jgi:tetrahydromethanopterin S-methyltransferase subunit A
MNLFHEAFPEVGQSAPTTGKMETATSVWPPINGEYFVLSEHENCHVAVSTLSSISLAEELARLKPKALCIVGKTETENVGIDKVIKNTITNPSIHVLIVAGKDSEGHRSGATLLSLCESGVDERMRVIGSPGERPILKNVTKEEVEAFRNQVKVVDMIGCEDAKDIAGKVEALSRKTHMSCGNKEFARMVKPLMLSSVEVVQAEETERVEMDKAGYFVILPLKEKGVLSVEHYSNDNQLLRIIEGRDSRSLYRTIVKNGWISQLSHAAYLGKELDRAELSMKLDFKYIQDGA